MYPRLQNRARQKVGAPRREKKIITQIVSEQAVCNCRCSVLRFARTTAASELAALLSVKLQHRGRDRMNYDICQARYHEFNAH
jgi:hypothetical protein